MKTLISCSLIFLLLPAVLSAQHRHDTATVPNGLDVVRQAEPQPLLAQAGRLADALNFSGSPLSSEDAKTLRQLQSLVPDSLTAIRIQRLLDPYCLAAVHVNPEDRVMVMRGPAKAVLAQGGWTSFLVKVVNEGSSTARLEVESGQAAPLPFNSASTDHTAIMAHISDRFLEMALYRRSPMQAELSGLGLEYVILQVYSKDKGDREAELGFNIGKGTQDIGFRNSVPILFHIRPAVKVVLQVKDDTGAPVMASFTITDSDSVAAKKLTGIYPLPSRRVAALDEYPDFYFEPQIYRRDGEHVFLAPGDYKITYTRGPEYLPQTRDLHIPSGKDSVAAVFRLKRWIDMAALGWYSADHHLHAAGCSHYENPEEGVSPPAMFRQALGEDLDMATVLSWAPGWDQQRAYFSGKVSPLSTPQHILRYDVEVSGFPSSHAGHLVLLNLKTDNYPGAPRIGDWPSWTLPILQWAKAQGGITAYAHSGWGLEPVAATRALPNDILPKMDGIGANEYIVAVTQNAVDLFSAGDTPPTWELNMWYHTLNCGFRTRLSGETDFPCIFDERVGIGRSYFKPDGALSYEGYLRAIRNGRSYVSDGRSHIIDFTVDGLEMGTHGSELSLNPPGNVRVTARAAAYLSAQQDEDGARIAGRDPDKAPYWSTERARIQKTRNVTVELIVNGVPVDTVVIAADGSWKDLHFNYTVKRSCWMALRIFPAAHTNPVFVMVNKKPILVRKSAVWCRRALDQCRQTKRPQVRASELAEFDAAYDRAAKVYDKLISEGQ